MDKSEELLQFHPVTSTTKADDSRIPLRYPDIQNKDIQRNYEYLPNQEQCLFEEEQFVPLHKIPQPWYNSSLAIS